MRNGKPAVLVTVLCLGAAAPALAAWDSLGTVDVSGDVARGRPGGMDRDVKNFDLGGPVERIQLRADRGNINCRSVQARFGNGANRDIFHGLLRQGRTTSVDLPGEGRDLNGLIFNCRSNQPYGGTINISADIGRYRSEWMRGPNWRNTWARVFNWGSDTVNNWQLVGTESFEGRGDSEQAFTGWRGVKADSVALRPLETDARCSRVTARFGNGRDQALNVNNGDVLRRGMYYKLDLPGGERNLTSLSLRCSATGASRVSIQIYTGR